VGGGGGGILLVPYSHHPPASVSLSLRTTVLVFVCAEVVQWTSSLLLLRET